MVWRESLDHASDCYFCAINTTGVNRKNRYSLQYPDSPPSRHPVAHCEEIPVSAFTELLDSDEKATSAHEVTKEQDGRQPLSQCGLNDPVRGLGLSKTSSELLSSRLKQKNLLGEDPRMVFYS